MNPKTPPLASSDDLQIHPLTMDVQHLHLPGPSAAGRVCPCACPFCCRPTSPSWRRSMKRRLEIDSSDNGSGEVENEADALREALASQQETIQELCAELDEERNAAASAASEAMSMILRLQREKAEAQMDARQFKLFAEEKMEHDQQELLDLEELILKREEGIQGLALQLQAYRDLLISHGIDPDDVDDDTALSGVSQFEEMHTVEYPPLKCNLPNDVDDAANLEEIAFGETPDADEDLDSLETRIYELETSPNLLDEVHEIATVGSSEDCFDTQREKCKRRGTDGRMEGGTPDIWNLCMRLQALEADRDSMRQTIISMRTEKAQLVLLRELAQQLHKDPFLPERRIAKKNSSYASFSLVAQLEWLLTFLLWRKKPSRTSPRLVVAGHPLVRRPRWPADAPESGRDLVGFRSLSHPESGAIATGLRTRSRLDARNWMLATRHDHARFRRDHGRIPARSWPDSGAIVSSRNIVRSPAAIPDGFTLGL
ncbi:hypothetical protein ZIOFF_011834 [Zingiber officinale]|uniref:GTD-binding domain-containing protein n=1 Tax=Zingiber officinale TaxID=94328 RepID=A0A8J5LZZ5_ZINOF|nr:hypothetical protein ZIOFF_011834 [Zingiber officinale]